MAASREEVNSWIQTAKDDKFQYIISVCDTWDFDDYPVYCNNLKELQEALPYYQTENLRINEIIEIKNGKAIEDLQPSKFI